MANKAKTLYEKYYPEDLKIAFKLSGRTYLSEQRTINFRKELQVLLDMVDPKAIIKSFMSNYAVVTCNDVEKVAKSLKDLGYKSEKISNKEIKVYKGK